MGKTNICPIYLLRSYEEQQQKIMKILCLQNNIFVTSTVVPSWSSLLQGCSKCGLGIICIWMGPCGNSDSSPSIGLLNWIMVVGPEVCVFNKDPVMLMSIRVWECWSVVYWVWTATSSLYFCSSTISATFSPLSFLLFFLVIFPDHLFGFTPVKFL